MRRLSYEQKIAGSLIHIGRLKEKKLTPEHTLRFTDLVKLRMRRKRANEIFYSSEPTIYGGAEDGVAKAIRQTVADIGSHARVEYGRDGKDHEDRPLNRETRDERQARSEILAAMTKPESMEDIEERAERLANFFDAVITGKRINVPEHDSVPDLHRPQEYKYHPENDLFAVINGGHSSGWLTLQEGSPVHRLRFNQDNAEIGTPVLQLELPVAIHFLPQTAEA